MTTPDHIAALTLAGQNMERNVALAAADPAAGHSAYPEEVAALVRATPKRLNEFGAGRYAARQAMDELGAPAMPIPMGPDRAPVWPPGMVGSITHCPTAVLAAVGWEGEVQMLGLDLEPDEDLDAELWPAVLTNQETDWVREQPDGARWAKRIFSAKEAVYKAQFPVSHTLFDFHALQILFDPEERGFHAEFQRDVAPFAKGQQIDGHIGLGQGLVLASVVVEANSAGGTGPASDDLI